MGTMQFRFPDEQTARGFVRYLAKTLEDVACLRSGADVWVVDGTHIHSRDVLRAASQLFGGHAV